VALAAAIVGITSMWSPERGQRGSQVSDSDVDDDKGQDTAPPPPEVRNAMEPTQSITWTRAVLIGFGVFAYFAVLTVWLPSAVLRLNAIASSASWVQDIVVTGLWSVALAAGLIGLRQAQRRGWI